MRKYFERLILTYIDEKLLILGSKIDGNYTRILRAILNRSWKQNTPQSSKYTAIYHPSRKLSKLDEPDMQDTAGEAGTSS